MQTPSILPAAIVRYRTPVLAGLIAAGLAGNYFSFPLFLNVDFLFGSIFALLVLQFFGLGRGMLAAAIVAGYTYFLWNHPYAIVIMTAEVGAVGWQMERSKRGMVLADMLFWLIIGMPLVYFFYHMIMHVSPSSTHIVMIKQAVNGIANAVAARLLFTGVTCRRGVPETSYGELICNLLAFFVLCPALIILITASRDDFNEIDKQVRLQLVRDNQLINQYFTDWAAHKEESVAALAEMAALRSPQQMQSSLEQTARSNNNFLRIGLLDKEATVTAYFPVLDEFGQQNIGKNFADRPFIPVLKRTLKPLFSEVVMGRIGTPRPMVTILAPVVIHGEYAGYVTGILSLDRIRALLDACTNDTAILFTLVDRNGNVIMTNRPEQKVMQPFMRGQGTFTHLDAGVSQWSPGLPSDVPTMERWKNSLYVEENSIGGLAEWKLIIEQPVAPFQKTLNEKYAGKLALLFLLLCGAIILAEFISRRAIASLVHLRLFTRDIPVRLERGDTNITFPASCIKEIDQLIGNFREMADSLTARFNDIRQMNEMLELRVGERTGALKESEEKYRVLFHNELFAISLFDLETFRFLDVNDAHLKLYGYSREELMGGMAALELSAQPEESGKSLQEIMARGTAYIPLRLHKKKDGTVFPVEIAAGPYQLQGKKVIYALVRDISDRRQAEEALQEANRRLEAIIDFLPDPTFVLDSGGIVRYWNKAIEELTGVLKADMLGKDTYSIPFYGERRLVLIDLALAASSGTQPEMMGYDLLERDGDWFKAEIFVPNVFKGYGAFLSGTAAVLRDSSGKVAGAIESIRDITDQKQAEENRIRLERQVLQTQKFESLGRMAGAVSHHFNNMLAVVIGNLELALDFLPGGAESGAFISEAMASSHRAAEMSQLMLTYLGQTNARKERLDLARIAGDTESLLTLALPANVRLKTEIIGQEVMINADKGHISQIISNLINNAAEAIGEKEGCITVSVGTADHESLLKQKFFREDWRPTEETYACLSVADNGPGLGTAAIEKIFDPFYTTKFTGRGLGLAVVLGLVRASEGAIAVESNPGVRTVFRVYFPLVERKQSPSGEETRITRKDTGGGPTP